MTKFDFIGGVFLLFGALVPLFSVTSWLSYRRVRRHGKTEELRARARVSRGVERGRQVRLIVEFEDELGFPIELESRSTCSDWVAYDGAPVTVHYEPHAPLDGWIELDYRRRQKMVLLIGPLLLAVGGGVILPGSAVG